MLVSIVRWRHLSKQVCRVQICNCLFFYFSVILGYIVIYKEVSKLIYWTIIDHLNKPRI